MGNKTYKIPERLEKPVELSLSIIRLIKKMYDEEKIKAMDNINPYSILVSTKGSLAFVVLDENNSDNKESNQNKISVGFEKVRFDAPEVKMGFFFSIKLFLINYRRGSEY
jgi:hypothetical protein